jgi:hypothetical protein
MPTRIARGQIVLFVTDGRPGAVVELRALLSFLARSHLRAASLGALIARPGI